MKQIQYRNIDLLRIPIKAGIKEYYFPQNVDWSGSKVDRIAVCVPDFPCNDPMDGTTPVLSLGDYTDIYFNIYSADQKEILHAVSAEQLFHTNNNPLMLDSVLDLSLCNLYFTSAPASDFTLLLYVYHATEEKDVELPDNSVSFEFPLEAGAQMSFKEIIDTYVHALPSTVKGILFWTATTAPAYFTLRDYELKHVLSNLHSELARPNMNGGTADSSQSVPMLFANLNIDFMYSHIRNAESQANTQKITILY